jgi:hypothetical protein
MVSRKMSVLTANLLDGVRSRWLAARPDEDARQIRECLFNKPLGIEQQNLPHLGRAKSEGG